MARGRRLPIGFIDVRQAAPRGICLVFMAEEVLGSHYAVANYEEGPIHYVGGCFDIDMPQVLGWRALPKVPKYYRGDSNSA